MKLKFTAFFILFPLINKQDFNPGSVGCEFYQNTSKLCTLGYLIEVGDGITVLGGQFLKNQ